MHVMSDVVLFVYRVMLNNLAKNRIIKSYQRSYIVNLSDLCNAIKKILDKTSCHRRFKELYFLMVYNKVTPNVNEISEKDLQILSRCTEIIIVLEHGMKYLLYLYLLV